jgi:hypothetical protein
MRLAPVAVVVLLLVGLLAGCSDGATGGPPRPENPVPLPEGLVDASDPEPISDLAWRYGEARWGRDGFRDPVIDAVLVDGNPYRIEFYGCEEGQACRDIRFVALSDAEWTAEDIARWNAARRFGKAALTEDGRARVEMNAVLQGGVTRQNLDALFDWWTVVLADFAAGPES